MNRAERRKRNQESKREEKRKMTTRVTLSKEELDSIRTRASNNASKYTVDTLMICFALAEHRMHGFGKKRIQKTIDYIDELVGEIINDKSTLDDYVNQLKEETGIIMLNKR